MELLSPAGSLEALQAAVCAGADAVYLGATAFSARAGAANFDEEALPKAVRYAHLAHVKVLVTVNTLMLPGELEQAITLVLRLRDAGADGLIVQDLGLARELSRRLGGDVPLHASTQATIHNLPGVLEMADRGFDRVVLARELSLEDIAAIRRESPIELEAFAHGALCVSCSGACLMSSMIGGRSGNRGRCAQPCRLPYTLTRQGQPIAEGSLLSPKDLMTLPFLAGLKAAGVASLKIEGRLKRPEYVTLTTRAYRRALDAVESLGHYEPTAECVDELMRIFNRGGFTRGYYYGTEDAALMNHEQSGHTGVAIGQVADAARGRVTLEEPLRPGDGLQFRPGGQGMTIAGETRQPGMVRLSLPRGVADGAILYKTTDARLMESARIDGVPPRRPMDMVLTLLPGQPARLTLTADGLSPVTVESDTLVQKAQRHAVTAEDAARQLGKTDTLPWRLNHFTFHGEDAFMPVSQLNALRRDGLEALARAALADRLTPWSRRNQNPLPAAPAADFIPAEKVLLRARVLNTQQALAALEAGADGVDIAPEDFTALPDLSPLLPWRQRGIPVTLALPLWLPDRSLAWLEGLLDPLRPLLDGLMAPNIGTARFFLERGWAVAGDLSMNITHKASVDTLADLGLRRLTLSPELTAAQVRAAVGDQAQRCESVLYGRLALMHLVHCPYRAAKGLPGTGEGCRACGDEALALVDRKHIAFDLRRTRLDRCQMTVYNGVPMDTRSQLERIPALGGWQLRFLEESPRQVSATVKSYRGGTSPSPSKTHTTGHWFRGIE
jgi:putative protease